MKHKIINIFILTLMITSCKKEATKIDEISTIDDNFFILLKYKKYSNFDNFKFIDHLKSICPKNN
jgi:hypothetical protein